MYKWLLFEVSDQHVATITINRAEYMNSLPDDVCLELIDAFERCSADDNIRAVIFTGAGKNFCGGGDVKGFRGMIDRGVDLPASGMLLSAQVAYTIRNCAKPVVACVNGAAAGAGAAYVMACDFRVMTERTKLVGAFANIGFCGDSGGLYYMMRLVGAAKTMEFFMLGDIIRGAEAKNLGLCTVLAEDGKLMEESVALAQKLAAGPTKAFSLQKKMLNRCFYEGIPSLTVMEKEYMQECFKTDDFKEAVDAFLNKRTPEFQGK